MIARLADSAKNGGIAAMATAMGALSWVAFGFGVVYTFDCRSWAKSWDQASSCYLTGGSMAGVGGLGRAAQGMFNAGYNTFNPALRASGGTVGRKPDDPDQPG